MKQKNILTWAISAIVYLGLVIGGYIVYASLDSNNDQTDIHGAKTNGNEEKESINEQAHNDNHTSHHGEHEEKSLRVDTKLSMNRQLN